ncbi:hypothetical protein [Ureaplasma canigenitalium]|uniref:hypothetical protein n=1 Tax=Ureaplasma canigenitalium TaxID=42092 RepID=UPI0004E12720|nr:hypothetical protein [Ureaplasma canigenitalium]
MYDYNKSALNYIQLDKKNKSIVLNFEDSFSLLSFIKDMCENESLTTETRHQIKNYYLYLTEELGSDDSIDLSNVEEMCNEILETSLKEEGLTLLHSFDDLYHVGTYDQDQKVIDVRNYLYLRNNLISNYEFIPATATYEFSDRADMFTLIFSMIEARKAYATLLNLIKSNKKVVRTKPAVRLKKEATKKLNGHQPKGVYKKS